jgi:hypothetical protein
MTHTPRAVLIAAFAWPLLAAGTANAATRHLSAPATRLEIDSPCARQVVITGDDTIGAQVTVDAVADHEEETSQLVLTGGDSAKLSVPERCWRPGFTMDFRPTLVLNIHVAPGAGIGINESGEAEYKVGDIGGPLNLDLSGAVRVQAGKVGALSLDLSGTGAVTVAQASGALQASLSGLGSLDIADGTVSAASLELSGRGSVQFRKGTIGKLTLSSSGTSNVTIGATVGDASIEVSGISNVKIAKVTGSVSKDVSGVASVVIGGE